MPVIVRDLAFSYGERVIFDSFSCEFRESQITGVVGPSGSGKSTLLANLVGAESPRAGSIEFPASLTHNGELVRHRVAWMTQTANLMLRRTSLDNVALPLRSRGIEPRTARRAALAGLNEIGLSGYGERRCLDLSGGERQRVAMARALVGRLPLLIADEPTASLDRLNRQLLLDGLRTVASAGAIVIVATHDPEVVETCDHIIDLTAVAP